MGATDDLKTARPEMPYSRVSAYGLTEEHHERARRRAESWPSGPADPKLVERVRALTQRSASRRALRDQQGRHDEHRPTTLTTPAMSVVSAVSASVARGTVGPVPTVHFDGAAYIGHFDLEQGIGMVEALADVEDLDEADTSEMVAGLDRMGWSTLEDTDGGPLVAGLTEHGYQVYAVAPTKQWVGDPSDDLTVEMLARQHGAWKALAKRASVVVLF